MEKTAIPVLVLLTGEQRGSTIAIDRPTVRIGSSAESDVRIPATGDSEELYATLEADENSYRLHAVEGHQVWVNGQPAHSRRLSSGDILEIGQNGPLLRYRLYPSGSKPHKSVREALADCYLCAQAGPEGPLGSLWLFLRGILGEIATQTSPLSRIGTFAAILLLVAIVAMLSMRAEKLEEKLVEESRRVEGLQELLESTERSSITAEELETLRRDLEGRISSAGDRLDFLEERAGAAQRTIAEASRSVLFLQGAYGFQDSEQRDLRFVVGHNGQPRVDSEGSPEVSASGAGPVIEALFTGTGFVATNDGLVVTNRHVALPWEADPDARRVLSQGLQPVMRRLIGYMPGTAEPFDLALVVASETSDLAVLRCSNVTAGVRSLSLQSAPPRVGESVLVMGFPTGIQAILARADKGFLDRFANQRLDFWQIARQLSKARQIGPLASRGIVGQVTESTIVYDAETTSGGSGGPVLSLDGRVVAINSAILRQFSGSNLGVPAQLAQELIEVANQLDSPAIGPVLNEPTPASRP